MSKYYNGDRILNNPQPFNFLLGNRGTGKSYYWKRYCIKRFLSNGEKFIYVRRYKADIDKVVNGLFDDVQIQLKKEVRYEKGTFYCENEVCGTAIAVSEFTKFKSANFQDYNTILFDEFLPEDGKYIGGSQRPLLEPELCLNFYQTVARGYNKVIRDDVLFIFISNSVTINNPYFVFYNIDKKLKLETKFLKGKGFNVEVNRNKAIANEIQGSKFGELIAGTQYEKYAIGNEFYLDTDEFIEQPKGKQTYISNIMYNGQVFGFIYFEDSGIYYITDKPDMDYAVRFSLTHNDHSIDCVLMQRADSFFKTIRLAYKFGKLRFKNQRCKSLFESIIK